MTDIVTVDMHLGGEPARIVVGGMPPVYGSTMREKQEYIRENYDYIRTSLMLEPRGHNDMFGAILLEPCSKEADYGAVFMFGSNFEDLCGHATLCICTLLVDRKMVEVTEPVTKIKLDTPAGLVDVSVDVKDGKAQSVSLDVVPGFVYRRNVKIPTKDYGTVDADLVYAGNAFIMIDADRYGAIEPANALRFADIGMQAVEGAQDIDFVHPELGKLRLATVNFYSGDRDMIIFGAGQVDRSPCGTGTSSKIILLADRGELKVGEPYVNRGMLGTELTGTITGTEKVGDFDAYDTRLTGLGVVTADSVFHIGPEDPLYKGFRIG
jgi:proline racemase